MDAATWLKEYRPYLLTVARRVLNEYGPCGAADAEDAVQVASWRLYRQWPKVRAHDNGQLRYARAAVRTAAIDVGRKRWSEWSHLAEQPR